MSLTPEEYVQRLTEISQKKLNMLIRIKNITRQQSEAIEKEDVDALNYLINNKAEIMQKVDELDDQFELYFEGFKTVLNVTSLDQITTPYNGLPQLKGTVTRVFNILKETMQIDEKNCKTAKELKEKIAREIRKINMSKVANRAYMQQPIQPSAIYVDRKK